MATARKIYLTPEDSGVFSPVKPSLESAKVASRLLQENHEKYNLIFNDKEGFHNHIVHLVLTLYGLGAPPDVIERSYKANTSYQQAIKPLTDENVAAMSEPHGFKSFLGDAKHTHDYLEFFQREIEKKGVEAVVQEYLFSGTEIAEDMLVRLFMGFLHPIIHLGFGLEFKQPAIVAEALAETAVHDNWLTTFFTATEKAAQENQVSKTLAQLLDEVSIDEKLKASPKWSDANKIRDGILARAPQEMIHYASQFRVPPDQLVQKTAEMIDFTVFFTAAAQRPPKEIRMDFYFLHCANASIFWLTFNKIPWLSVASKCRLLEWKGRFDLAMYVSRASPRLLKEEIEAYALQPGTEEAWNELSEKLFDFDRDDGHAVKLLRAIGAGEQACGGLKTGKVKEGQWLGIGKMVVENVESVKGSKESPWVRSAGFDNAWQNVRERVVKTSL